jgi:hypothetical protein
MQPILMREFTSTDDLLVMRTLDQPVGGTHLEIRRPGTAGPLVDSTEITRFLARWLPSGVSRPTAFAIDLEGIYLSPGALRELLVPLGKASRAGTYGALAVVICTSDSGTVEVARALAVAEHLALYAAPSPRRLAEAQPLAPLTPTERETLEVLRRLGGNVTVATFARETGLAPSAATNRLVNVAEKGLVHRTERSRRQGVLFEDPRAATPGDPWPEELERELEVYAKVTGASPHDLLVAAWSEFGQEAGAAAQEGDDVRVIAWHHFRRARGEELAERMTRGKALLNDPAAVVASETEPERLARLRDAFSE